MSFADAHPRLAALVERTLPLTGERDAGAVLDKLTRAARELLAADGAFACVCGNERTHHAASGAIAKHLCTLCSHAPHANMNAGDALFDSRAIAAFLPPEERERPYLSIPMAFAGARRGVLVVAGKPGAPQFTEEDGWLALTLTMQGALAFENAVLYEGLAEAQRVLEQRVEERTRELYEINRELETFSYSVSHDLRAPLRAIHGFTGLLLSNHTAQLDDKGRGLLTRVRDAVDHMGELIGDLLALSRCVRTPMIKTRVDASALALDIVRELTAGSRARDVGVEIDEALFVYADRKLLRMILANLLGNAWKFTGKRADALIELRRCANGEDDTFVVRDNGVGFDMSHAADLFAPFQRLHSRHDFEGTGVGLATVQRLVSRHGGRVWAESSPDRGAAFYVALPKGGEAP
jgi:signal transduction histidine kinase